MWWPHPEPRINKVWPCRYTKRQLAPTIEREGGTEKESYRERASADGLCELPVLVNMCDERVANFKMAAALFVYSTLG